MKQNRRWIDPATWAAPRANWLPPLLILLTLAILAGTIYFGATQLRPGLRRQIVDHDGEVLYAVARMEQARGQAGPDLAHQLRQPAGQFALALRLSQLKQGVLAVRLFDAAGQPVIAVPFETKETVLTRDELASLSQLRPLSRFEPRARLEDFFVLSSTPAQPREPVPLHLALVPIQAPGQTNLLAVAQLILEGQSIAAEFARLDQFLWRQAVAAFVVSGAILIAALAWAFRWFQKINLQLQEQASHLRRANQELVLAAKASALGAVTAHLMHGLTSPLTGLQQFVISRANGDAESEDAVRSTERMQALIAETVRLLSEEHDNTQYELPVVEIIDVLMAKIQPLAQSSGVLLETQIEAEALVSSRDANLVALILENLLRNAIDATPQGKTVRLRVLPAVGGLICRVEDQGPGLTEGMSEQLFKPGRSTKPGGHGIGLAISKQLARHLGAELELAANSAAGCVFALRIPSEKPALDTNQMEPDCDYSTRTEGGQDRHTPAKQITLCRSPYGFRT